MKTTNYLIQEPKEYSHSTSLMILLHGYGSNNSDLFSLARGFPLSMLIVSIQAPIPLSSGGFSWFEISFLDKEKFNNLQQAEYSQQLILKFIKNLSKNYTFNQQNIWLCGFSQGAILSYSLILNHPQQFKKGIFLSGYLDRKIVNQKDHNIEYENLEIFISHGVEDNIIPIEWTRETYRLLQNLRIKTTYREYQSGHELNQKNYHDMIYWINQRI